MGGLGCIEEPGPGRLDCIGVFANEDFKGVTTNHSKKWRDTVQQSFAHRTLQIIKENLTHIQSRSKLLDPQSRFTQRARYIHYQKNYRIRSGVTAHRYPVCSNKCISNEHSSCTKRYKKRPIVQLHHQYHSTTLLGKYRGNMVTDRGFRNCHDVINFFRLFHHENCVASHSFLYLRMSIRNKYRTADIHDVMEIERNPNSEFDPEPTTLAAVCIHLFVADV